MIFMLRAIAHRTFPSFQYVHLTWSLILVAMTILTPVTAQEQEAIRKLSAAEVMKRARLKVSPVFSPETIAVQYHELEERLAVEVKINRQGEVVNARFFSGVSLLKDAAIEAAKKWRFAPIGEKHISHLVGVIFFDEPSEVRSSKLPYDISYYQEWALQNPDSWLAQCRLGTAYIKSRMSLRAVGAYLKAVSLEPKAAVAWYGLGGSYDRLYRDQEALEAYLKATELNPDFLEAWHNAGLMYKRLSRVRDCPADRLLNEAVGEREGRLHVSCGGNDTGEYQKQGPPEIDMESLERAIRVFDSVAEKKAEHRSLLRAYGNLVGLHYAIGNFGKAAEAKNQYNLILKERYEADPEWELGFLEVKSNILGILWEKAGRLEDALRAFQETLRRNGDADASFVAGLKAAAIYKKLGNQQEAEKLYAQMLEKSRSGVRLFRSKIERSVAWHDQGLIYEAMGRDQEAVEAHKKAAELNRWWIKPHVSLFNLYTKLGNKEAASEQFTIITKIDEESALNLKGPYRIYKIK
jgi:tetratricopeptide (TPR) repeat protein